MDTTQVDSARLEVFVREDVPGPTTAHLERLLDRFARLQEGDAVDSVAVHRWPKRIAVDGDEPADPVARDRYAEFSAWARERGVDLYPFFDTRECYSMATARQYTALVLPVLSVGVYVDGDLRTVLPHESGDTTYTVVDYLRRLETDLEGGADGGVATPVAD